MKALIRSLALITMLGIPAAHAQTNDPELLRQARRDRELATQKAESDLRSALNKAKTQPAAEALSAMKKLLADIDTNAMLDPSRKGDMVKELQSRIAMTERNALARGEKIGPTPAEQRRARDEARRTETDKQETERQKIAKEIAEIDRLLGQGRNQEADRRAQRLAQDYPTNQAAKAMGQRTSIQVNIRDAKEALARMEDSRRREMNDGNKPLPKDDLDFDKKRWDIAKKRNAGEKLTEKEQAILKAMSKTMTPDFKGAKFDSVIEALQTALGTTIVVDQKAREELNITSDTTVNFTLPREISTRTVLRKVLLDAGLAYVIKEEMIYVTTVAKTKDLMTTRAYYIGDIVTGNPLETPLPGQMQEKENAVVKAIMDSIKRSVDPMSWEESGRASIHYDPVTRALIVRQSAEVHMLLRNSMK